MPKQRLEAFSDGVLAIIITIMVLELRLPEGSSFAALWTRWPVFLSYALSFVYIAIYWNNHQLLLSSTHRISPQVLWANMHLLFWLSLVPFVTDWMGESHFAGDTLLVYGVVLLGAALAYWLLQTTLIRAEGPNSKLALAVGRDLKGKISPVLYCVGIIASRGLPWLAGAAYVAVALIWLIPDGRLRRQLPESEPPPHAEPPLS